MMQCEVPTDRPSSLPAVFQAPDMVENQSIAAVGRFDGDVTSKPTKLPIRSTSYHYH